MIISATNRHSLATTLAVVIVTTLAGCGSKEPPTTAPTTAVPAPAPAPGADVVPASATTAPAGNWSPEAMEELLAPIALYPDPVLSQMLIASTNPQEVLDSGNWLLQNKNLKGKALDDAAAKVGFTPPIRALVQFPETIDMMCLEMGWTTELGEAFTADQAGVLDAIQRLRKQAKDVGNLKSSDQMLVESEEQEGKEVVVLKPAQPEVVYVPQYDPQTAYAPPPPAAAAPAAAPAATTSTETTTTGHSTGSMVATGVLAFGAGILVNELFDDDDDHHNDYYYPNYGHGGMPYYPPYPYRPTYGNGYYPSNGYNRPPNYNSGFQNTGNVVINTGGGNRPGGANNNYWNRFDNNPRAGGVNGANNRATANTYNRSRTGQSPITAARPNRNAELNQLSQRQPRPMPADVRKPSPNATASNWKGQNGYAGKANKSGGNAAADRIAQATPAYSKPPSKASGTRSTSSQAKPKVQGSYAGAANRSTRDDANRPSTGSRDTPKKPSTRDEPKPKPRPDTGNVQRPTGGDRGYEPASRPSMPAQQPHANRPSPAPSAGGGGGSRHTAMSGANKGGGDRAASQRGKQSMPQGARSKGGGGGGRQGR